MKTILNWRKATFRTVYEIYAYNTQIGKLKEKQWSQSAEGELNGHRYSFISKGTFKCRTRIIDSANHKVIGNISYNTWMTKATINYSDRLIQWKYNNTWNTKWSMYDHEGTKLCYRGTSSKGQIESDVDDDMLILTGLYIANYNWQVTTIAVIMAVIIPIIATALH